MKRRRKSRFPEVHEAAVDTCIADDEGKEEMYNMNRFALFRHGGR